MIYPVKNGTKSAEDSAARNKERTMKIGFDNQKYLKLQSERILERVAHFGGKLYLEFGGKLFDDYHASRVLPGFQPDSKMKVLLQLKEQAEIVIAINAAHIEMNKRRGDLGITYDLDVMRLIDTFRSIGLYVVSVVIRPFRFEGERRSAQADEALARLALYSDMVLRFDNDAMESLIDPDKGVLEAFSVVNALIARAVLIVPSLLNSSGNLLRVGLDDLLSVAGTGKGICSFGVGEASADASVADILNQVRHSPLFLEKRLGEVDDVLVLVRGGGSLTLQRLEDLVDGVAEILGRGVRLHIGASVEQQPEERLSLTVLGAVPVAETSVSPSVVLQREAEPQTVLVPEEKSFLGEGKTIIQPAPPAPVDEPERHPEPDLSVPVSRRDERELEEELVPGRPVSDIPDEGETLRESASVAQISETEAEPELESVPMPDIKELEEGLPPEEGEEERAGHGLFARVRPLILDGEDLDLPPALRKRKPDPS